MNLLGQQIEKARHSGFRLWLLNQVLLRKVPFNAPHGLKVDDIGADSIRVTARNRRRNRNHIKGVHACLLATLCEYASGLSLLRALDPASYRIILKHIHMTYHYQAKEMVTASFTLPGQWLKEQVLEPLQTEEAIFREFTVEVYDNSGNHICTGRIHWQIKAWSKVRTK